VDSLTAVARLYRFAEHLAASIVPNAKVVSGECTERRVTPPKSWNRCCSQTSRLLPLPRGTIAKTRAKDNSRTGRASRKQKTWTRQM